MASGLLLVTFNAVFLLHGTIAKVYTCKNPFNMPMLTSNEHITVVYIKLHAELGRLLTNCNPLLIPDYMTKIVVSNVIRYITHFR